MKIKQNHLLTMAIMSLLGVSQSAEAVLYAPTTIAGKTIVIEYADAAQQNAFSTSDGLGAGLLGNFQTGLQNPAGLITGSTVNGSVVSIINIGSGKVTIVQPQVDGTTTYITVSKSADGLTSALTMAQEYLNVTSTPGYTPNPAISSAVLQSSVSVGADAALLDTTLVGGTGPNKDKAKGLIIRSMNDLATAVTQPPLKVTSATINPDAGTLTDVAAFAAITDAKAIVEASVANQAMSTTLNAAKTAGLAAVVAGTAVPVPASPATVATGAVTAITQDPDVKLAAAKTTAAASTTVVAAILADPAASPLLKTVGAEVKATSDVAAVTALTDPGLTVKADATTLAAATTAVAASTTSLQTQTAALVAAAATDPTLAAAATAAQTQLTAVASQAATAQSSAATAIAAAPGATLEQITAATAAVAEANATVTSTGGTLTQAQIDAAAAAAAAATAAQNAIIAALSGAAKTAAQALVDQSTVVNANTAAVVAQQTKATALTAAKAAFDAALAGTDSALKTTTLAAYQAAATASQAAAAAGKTAADAIAAAKLAYRDAQQTYVNSLPAADPALGAEQAKLATANTELTAAQADAAAAAQAVTESGAALTAIATNTAAGGAWVFSSAAVVAAQAVVDAKQVTVAAAQTAATATKTAAAAAKTAYDAAIANPAATAAEKAAALVTLMNAITADVNAQKAVVTALDAKIVALNAVKTAAGVTAAEIAAADAQIATATTDKAAANAQIAAVLQTTPMDAAQITAASHAETNKVIAAIGTVAAVDVLAAQAKLDTALANLNTTDAKTYANELAQKLAEVKTTQFQAKNNSTSGIAGNPASNMNMSVDSMFNQVADFGGTNAASTSNVASASSDMGGISTSMGVGLQYGYYNIGDKSVNTVTMPLSVTAKFNAKHQLTLSVPLSYIQTQSQADAYQVGVTAAYKYNVADNWSLTPAVTYSYRSFDNSQNQYWNPNTSTSLVGGSITSKYTWNFNPVSVSLINMIGHFQTLDSTANTSSSLAFGAANNAIFGNGGLVTGQSNGNKAVASYVVKNGLHATKAFGNFKLGAYFTDTEYFGTDLYFNQLNEFGFSLKPVNSGKMLDALSIDANYLFSIAGKHSSELDGFRLNLGYKF